MVPAKAGIQRAHVSLARTKPLSSRERGDDSGVIALHFPARVRQREDFPYVPLFAVVPLSAAIFAAVCMWPSQRFSNGAGMPNWSSTRPTM